MIKLKDKLEYDDRLLAYKLKMARLILDRELPIHKERSIFNFLYYYVNFEFKETNTKFEEEINSLTNKNIKEMITFEEVLLEDAELTGFFRGKKEGEKKGKQEAKENEVYRRIVRENLTDQQIADYADVSLNLVKKVRKKLESKKMIY